MGILDDELSEVKRLCERKIVGSKLVSCVKTMVRVEIKRTAYKHIIVCSQFSVDYPNRPILLELKSKTLSEKLLYKLSNVCEEEAKKYLGKPQILPILTFLRTFLDENPLCCCYDEINTLKKTLTSTNDEFKLRQKSSSIQLKIVDEKYYFECKILVPDDYPVNCVRIENVNTNFSPAFQRHMISQANEIARRCVEAPAKPKKNDPPFKATPSLQKVAAFLIDCVKRLPSEKCQFCNEICFPINPEELVFDENAPKHIERVYCGHLFHLDCFFAFMKKPPFGNKKCGVCGNKIFHHKWSLNDRLAEERWAHEQARERELAEVEDFFK